DQTKLLGDLEDAHIKVSDAALRALAIAQAGGGDKAVQKVIDAMKHGESAQKALADAQAKWGKLVEDKMLGLDAQMAKFHGDIAGLFKDIAVEPFLKALQKLLSLFDDSTVTGHALHEIITAVGNKLVSWATAAIPYIIAGFKQMLIWGLKIYIAMARFFNSDLGKGLITVLKIIGVVLLALVGASALALGTLTAMFMLPMAGIA